MSRYYFHLDLEKRNLISDLLKLGKNPREISEKLCVNISTVYREIKRGTNPQTNKYDPEYAQQRYQENLNNKGKTPYLEENTNTALELSKLILVENLSPEQAIKKLKQDFNFQVPSKTTVYSAIDRGIIPNVNRDTLNSKSTNVFSDGLVHLPKWIRKKLDIKDGDELSVSLEDEQIVLSKVR